MHSTMYFHLVGYFNTSAPANQADADIAALIGEANETFLTKGAPAGKGAKILNFRIEDQKIHIEIESDRYVRAHDAILRFKKPLAAILGKKYRIGIRGIEIESFVVKFPSNDPVKSKKIPYVSNIEFDGQEITVEMEINESQIQNRIPDRIITLIEDKIAMQGYGGKEEHWNLLWESEQKQILCTEDPTAELLKESWIKHGAARGQWIYGPEITRLFRAFESIVVKEVLEFLGYREMIFPKLVPWSVWERSGHAKGVYPEIYYVCPPKTRDPDFWEEVSDYYKVTHEVPLDLIEQKIDKPIGGLCYAQCPPFWHFLQGTTIADDTFPARVFDRSGTSHRYESGGIHGIERVDEFHRIEIVWMGTPEQVVEESERIQERYKYIFEEILELTWRKAWVTPWFMAQEGLTGTTGSEKVGTIDYESFMPYREGWLEFQNVSVNGDKYPGGFGVKSQSGSELWSGCSGVGLERWASALLAQKGLDPENWSPAFQRIVGKLPRGFTFL